MRKSHFNDRPMRIDLSPPCTLCGAPMFLSLIEPADEPGYDRRNFECTACRFSRTVMVKYTEMGEDA
jgi:hypothetical protein